MVVSTLAHRYLASPISAIYLMDQVTQKVVAQGHLRGQEMESVLEHTSLQEDCSEAAKKEAEISTMS